MIELKLQLSEKKLIVKNIDERWEDLNAAQLRIYAETFFPYRKQLFEVNEDEVYVKPEYEDLYHQIRMALLCALLQLPEKQFLRIPEQHINDMLEHHKLVQFFITSPWVVVNNPVPDIHAWTWSGTIRLYGPTIEFHATTLEEFIVADKFYNMYIHEPDDEHLHMLMAVFYRPQVAPSQRPDKLSSDLRRPYHGDRLEDFIGVIRKQKQWKKILFYMWYESARSRMVSRFRECFTASSDTKGPSDIMSQLLGFARNAQDFDKVKSLPVYLVMSDAQKGIIAAKEAESKMGNTNGGINFSV